MTPCVIPLRVRQICSTSGRSCLRNGKPFRSTAAYQELLSNTEGMRLLADYKMVQKRYGEESDLRAAAQRLEEVQKIRSFGKKESERR